MTDANAKVVWSSDYLAFGGVAGVDGGYQFSGLFTGKDFDGDTGLYYFNARWYNPDLGRFISEDPTGQGTNWYAYCGNSPLVFTDPTGMWYFSFFGIMKLGEASSTGGIDVNLGIFSVSAGPKGVTASVWAPLLGVPDPNGFVEAGVIWGGSQKGVYVSYATLGTKVEAGLINWSLKSGIAVIRRRRMDWWPHRHKTRIRRLAGGP